MKKLAYLLASLTLLCGSCSDKSDTPSTGKVDITNIETLSVDTNQISLRILTENADQYAYRISPEIEPQAIPFRTPVPPPVDALFFREAQSKGQTGMLTDDNTTVVIGKLQPADFYYIEIAVYSSQYDQYSHIYPMTCDL